ncbi:DUF1330 domain-containing protein [Vibrio rarus]|uniref:DUF1330 domain-containing protein n=1 Tax=Vibrio rarus TaxID=413403 RepID=UPI0021C338C2|nr:DUF1330 domain-containing protein [Vibrio rarus]
MSKYYSILQVTPTTQDWIAAYMAVANDLVAKHGGIYLARTQQHQTLEGDLESPLLRIIMQWPSKQAALNFMADPAYQPYLQSRTQGSISHHSLVKAIDELK